MALVKSFLFARQSRVDTRPVFVQVDAFSKDLAVTRLASHFWYIAKTDWDFIEELEVSHDIGGIGTRLKFSIASAH